MFYIFFGLLLIAFLNNKAMEQGSVAPLEDGVAVVNERFQIERVVAEINARKKPYHEKIAYLMLAAPLQVKVPREQFEVIKILCKPVYEPVLKNAIGNKVISAETYYESEYKIPVKINLLFEAMNQAIKSKKHACDEMSFEGVVTLIKNGANPNQEGSTYEEEQRERWGRSVCKAELPLEFAAYNSKLVKVLLTHGAIPTGQILFSIIFAYRDLVTFAQKELYQSLQHMLDHGADVNKVCVFWGPYNHSPLEYACARKETDLIKLFKEHVKKQSP